MNGMIVTWDQWSKASAVLLANRLHDPIEFLHVFKTKMELERILESSRPGLAHLLMIRDLHNEGRENHGAWGFRPGHIPFADFIERRFLP